MVHSCIPQARRPRRSTTPRVADLEPSTRQSCERRTCLGRPSALACRPREQSVLLATTSTSVLAISAETGSAIQPCRTNRPATRRAGFRLGRGSARLGSRREQLRRRRHLQPSLATSARAATSGQASRTVARQLDVVVVAFAGRAGRAPRAARSRLTSTRLACPSRLAKPGRPPVTTTTQPRAPAEAATPRPARVSERVPSRDQRYPPVHSSKSEQPTQESPLRPVLHAVRTT